MNPRDIYSKFIYCLLALSIMLPMAGCGDEPKDDPSPQLPDKYIGNAMVMTTLHDTKEMTTKTNTHKKSAPHGSVITRTGRHQRKASSSVFNLDQGLAEGTYRLLYLEFPVDEHPRAEDLKKKWKKAYFGLGARVEVAGGEINILDHWDSQIGLYGEGTAENPYIIAWGDHLSNLAHYVNSELTNSKVTEDTHFKQVADIDMDEASFLVDMRYGWKPIGSDTNHPFRGVYSGKGISNLWSYRPKSPGIGLFGYLQNASIDGVELTNADIEANFASAALAGAIITAGDARDKSAITNCKVENSSVKGSDGSVSIGGILGAIDYRAMALIHGCENVNTEVSASYNAGGIVGNASMYSLTSITSSRNSGRITAEYSGAGGMIGTADTIYATSCENYGLIRGGQSQQQDFAPVGTGGICGGSGTSFFTACINSAEVTGAEGVGGILGSTRVKGSPSESYVYNNAVMRHCRNSGSVSGDLFVGGIAGEAQFGCYGALNEGQIRGKSYVAGIAGNTSIAVAHNAINTGAVEGTDYVSGIIGKTGFGSVALNHNYGNISASGSHTAGILGLGGNNTIIHYCGNFGDISNPSGKYIGGIVGEIGDPRKWTAMNIAECVVGSIEIIMSVAGPCIAVAEHVVGSVCHMGGMVIKISEFAFDLALNATDAVLWSIGVAELACPETLEEIENSINAEADESIHRIADAMQAIRRNTGNYHPHGLSAQTLSSDAMDRFQELQTWYEAEGNDEKFNEAINVTRAERMEDVEKSHKQEEIVHQAIGGVCFVVGTVAAIGSLVASGGAAAPFIIAGSAAAVVGGTNAILKACGDFEENAVIISQCANAGTIEGGAENVGGLAGRLHDNSILRDCLNVGKCKGEVNAFVGSLGSAAYISQSLCAAEGWKTQSNGGSYEANYAFRNDGVDEGDRKAYFNSAGVIYLDVSELNSADIYKRYVKTWDISDSGNSRWKTTSGSDNPYPVPAHSEMKIKSEEE